MKDAQSVTHPGRPGIERKKDSQATPLATLSHILQQRGKEQAQATAYVFLHDDGAEAERVTYGDLDRRARIVASALINAGASGANVLMLYPTGSDFVSAFFGCLYAGSVAVPVQPGRGKKAALRLQSVIADCKPEIVLTTSEIAAGMTLSNSFQCIATNELSEPAALAAPHEVNAESIAFLQYTSGSTSAPKGTMVSHGNLMANLTMLQQATGTSESSVIVSWLPVFHDMGLIGNVLHAVFLGASAVLSSTTAFIQNPLVWLETISRYKGTFCGAPNFAYELCVQRTTPEQRARLDLSSWDVAFNGAEPVRAQTLRSFAQAFAPAGFRESTAFPTYGLAEATLIVSGTRGRPPHVLPIGRDQLKKGVAEAPPPGASPSDVHESVCCGRVDLGDQEVRIVDPTTHRECRPCEVGEIWIAGSNVAMGYWNNEAVSRDVFHARIQEDPQGRDYLRTGDLGFLRNGELFVAGRVKDLVIIDGQNHYPQDIEQTVEQTAGSLLVPGATVVVASQEDEARGITIVAELARSAAGVDVTEQLMLDVRREVAAVHQIPVQRVALVAPRTVPKTTSGKVQRRKCREELEAGTYEILAGWTAPTGKMAPPAARRTDAEAEDLESWLATWLSLRLEVPQEHIRPSQPFTDHGLTSAGMVELTKALSDHLDKPLDATLLWQYATIEELVRYLATEGASSSPRTRSSSAPMGEGSGSLEERLNAVLTAARSNAGGES